MITQQEYTRESSGGLVNTDATAYREAVAQKSKDKYIKGLEARLCKLENAMTLLQNTVNEMTK